AAIMSAHMMEDGAQVGIPALLVHLGNHGRLELLARGGTSSSEDAAQDARVHEMHLGRLGKPLLRIAEVGLELDHLIAQLQITNEPLGRGWRDVRQSRKVAEIDESTAALRNGSLGQDEWLEIPHRGKIGDIALEIRALVIVQ